LRSFCEDGSAPIPFAKMLPYAGTDIEDQLRAAGRLVGHRFHPDYRFLDPGIDDWFLYLFQAFQPWSTDEGAILDICRAARFEVAVLRRFCGDLPAVSEYGRRIALLTAWFNEIYCRTVEGSAPLFARPAAGTQASLRAIRQAVAEQQHWIVSQLSKERHDFLESGTLCQTLEVRVARLNERAGVGRPALGYEAGWTGAST
jgi:hypothetical protein